MIRYLSDKMASYIVSQDETADFEVISYGWNLIFQEIAVIVITLALAFPFGLLSHVLTAMISYHLLRRYAGGMHAKHRAACISVSVFTAFGPAFFFGKTEIYLSYPALAAMFAASLALLLLYAPADTEMRPIRNPQVIRRKKAEASILLTGFFVLALLGLDRFPAQCCVLMCTAFLVSCFTHPLAYRLFGCEKSEIKSEVVTS